MTKKRTAKTHDDLFWLAICAACGIVICVICGLLLNMSPRFSDDTVQKTRPIIQVLTLLGIGFVVYLLGILSGLFVKNQKLVGWTVLAVALVSRLILLNSMPFQEIDAYRYIWDGNLVANGISPYRYSPLEAQQSTPQSKDPLRVKIAEIRQDDPGLNAVLHRVHFSELPTAYPPTSQAVFCMAAWSASPVATSRHEAEPSLKSHLIAMKFWITAFDIGCLGLVFWLIRMTGIHMAWLAAYGWCPLVLKEFANTGHLDSIATFFMLLAIALAVRWVFGTGSGLNDNVLDDKVRRIGAKSVLAAIGIGLVLALGVGGKLFPIVIGPVLFFLLWKHKGLVQSLAFAIALLIGSVAILSPLFVKPAPVTVADSQDSRENALENTDVPTEELSPSDGLLAFLSRWRMNDFVFMNIQENIERPEVYEGHPRPWFVFVPAETRSGIIKFAHRHGNGVLGTVQGWLGIEDADKFQFPIEKTSFLLARLITLLLFAGITFWLAMRSVTHDSASQFLQAAFITVAWFWLTLPTQNPWYWCWALPLVAFARNRWWLSVSGLLLMYYLRFWLQYHYSGVKILNTEYEGATYFHFVITWFEHFPVLFGLLISSLWMRFGRKKQSPEPDSDKPNPQDRDSEKTQ